jgi:hypothetical protein
MGLGDLVRIINKVGQRLACSNNHTYLAISEVRDLIRETLRLAVTSKQTHPAPN